MDGRGLFHGRPTPRGPGRGAGSVVPRRRPARSVLLLDPRVPGERSTPPGTTTPCPTPTVSGPTSGPGRPPRPSSVRGASPSGRSGRFEGPPRTPTHTAARCARVPAIGAFGGLAGLGRARPTSGPPRSGARRAPSDRPASEEATRATAKMISPARVPPLEQ